jgi:hypothetical protein
VPTVCPRILTLPAHGPDPTVTLVRPRSIRILVRQPSLTLRRPAGHEQTSEPAHHSHDFRRKRRRLEAELVSLDRESPIDRDLNAERRFLWQVLTVNRGCRADKHTSPNDAPVVAELIKKMRCVHDEDARVDRRAGNRRRHPCGGVCDAAACRRRARGCRDLGGVVVGGAARRHTRRVWLANRSATL